MKIRALALVAAVAVPVAVTAARTPHTSGPGPLARATAVAGVSGTTFVRARTKTSGCGLGVLPDRACSPGAFDRGRPAKVVCDPSFHTSDVRSVPDSLKHQVEVAYGLQPKAYGKTLEIDHIISLELGGSNDVANLYPELAPGYHSKDALENKLHSLVCSGAITLHTAQRRIAANWETFYESVMGSKPTIAGSMPTKP